MRVRCATDAAVAAAPKEDAARRAAPSQKTRLCVGEYKLSRNIALYDLEIIKIKSRARHPLS